MSALAHFLESAGIATTLVALVRLHAEKIRPPRALWVPFELGQPVGPPGDARFHLRVIRAALALLERADEPCCIEDFPDESPDAAGESSWVAPVTAHPDNLPGEFEAARAMHQLWADSSGRTTVGLSGLEPLAALAYLQALARGESPAPPRTGMHPAQLMRFAADDLKALYLEAASTGAGNPNGVQLRTWFWRDTALAKLLHAVRARCRDDEDENLRTIGNGALVPVEWR